MTNDPTSARLPRPPQTVRLCFSGASALALPLGVSDPRLSSAALTPGNFGRSGAHPATLLGRSLIGSSAAVLGRLALGRLRLPAVLARFGPRPLRSAVVHDVVHVFCSYNCACC